MSSSESDSETHLDNTSIVDRLKDFTYYFVKWMENMLNIYLEILEGQVSRESKAAYKLASSVLEHAFPKFGKVIHECVKWGEMIISKKEAISLSNLVYYASHNKDVFRKILVEAAIDIFSSFEVQYKLLNCNGGPTRAMQKLAVDAAERILQYFADKKENVDITKEELIKGILFGKSAGVFKVGRTLKKEGVEWNTSEMYTNVGKIIKTETNSRQFYRKNENKYGYRKIFLWENVDEIKKNYTLLENEIDWPDDILKITGDLKKSIEDYVISKNPTEYSKQLEKEILHKVEHLSIQGINHQKEAKRERSEIMQNIDKSNDILQKIKNAVEGPSTYSDERSPCFINISQQFNNVFLQGTNSGTSLKKYNPPLPLKQISATAVTSKSTEKCACKMEPICLSNQCGCRKNGRTCTTRCHPTIEDCKNKMTN